MKIKKSLVFIVVLLIIITFGIVSFCQKAKFEDNQEFEKQKHFEIPQSLKINFSNSIKYCNTLHIAQNGAYESCMLDYIYKQSKEDYKLLLTVRKYCNETTDTEYDRRHCIDMIILDSN